MYRVYFLLSLITLSGAQIPSFGFCPDYLPMAHFDMNSFFGKWYEAERYFQFSEVASRCVVTDYAVGPNGKIYVSNEVTNRFTGVKRVIGGNLDLTGKKTEGRLIVKYDTTPISTTSTLTILETDYDNYAVIWSCSGLGPINAQSAWLMTRERIPDTTTLQKAYGVLDKLKISRTFFVKTDQEGCAIAASDLNAALGIASTSTNVDQTEGETSRNRVQIKAQPIAELLLSREEGKSEQNEVQTTTQETVSLKEEAQNDKDSEAEAVVRQISSDGDIQILSLKSTSEDTKQVSTDTQATPNDISSSEPVEKSQ
ncbi:hypothetical protein ABEB36_011132 [Hypothenemus hampei]|uniref:Lipocalin/cytosolic fatty-acid binding domain-containing protein n=1 Tax=Hypothenemus hampei TaxID=57062 RepID=A0ABD1EEJ8_HYPHA